MFQDLMAAAEYIEPVSHKLKELVYFDYAGDAPPDETYRALLDTGLVAYAIMHLARDDAFGLDILDILLFLDDTLKSGFPQLLDLLQSFVGWIEQHYRYYFTIYETGSVRTFPNSLSKGVKKTTLVEAERKARNCINAWATGALAVGWVSGRFLPPTAFDVKICQEVADCFGVKHWSAEAVFATIGASVTGCIVAVEAVSFIPVVGWAIKSAVAGVITKAVGEAIIKYFKAQSPYNFEMTMA